ncbi:hypothetical protein HYV22_02015, partial [Candidatus Gottesmanbacteria bacterium]|nr:hypothetical protein [Candidatus Gottesmanbacteria bacterium]
MKRLSSFFLLFVVVIVPLILPPSSSAYYTNMPASVVVGKPDFTSSDTSITSSNISIAGSGNNVFTDGKYLFVSDSHRVLLWNSIPTANGVSADVVLGQPDFISNTANNGGISARTFSGATGIAFDGTHLVVADLVNNRVLIWNSLPTVNQQPADVVIGQSGFSTATSGTSATAMTQPNGVYIVNGKLYIGAQHRVLIYNSIPTTNGAAANVVVGQPDFSSNTANNGGISASTLNNSRGIYVFNNKLFVSDSGNNRVLIWNSIPTTNGVAADIVLGQPDFVSNTAGVSCASMTLPSFIRVINNQRLVVGETNRVLIWNSIPTTNFTSADLVLGQPDCSASTSNNGGLSARSLNGGIRVGGEAGNKLIIGDTNNRRLLIFNNDLPDTKLTNTLVSGIENGRQRFKGTASTNVVNGVVRYVEYSINGSSWTGAFPADGQFNDATEDYSFDFDPKTNNADTGKNVGFVVRVRNTHNNTVDSGSSAVYF